MTRACRRNGRRGSRTRPARRSAVVSIRTPRHHGAARPRAGPTPRRWLPDARAARQPPGSIDEMAALLFGLLLLLVAGLTAVLGVGWLALLPLLVALAVLAWGGLTVASGRTPASEIRRVDRPELLGPGGPD